MRGPLAGDCVVGKAWLVGFSVLWAVGFPGGHGPEPVSPPLGLGPGCLGRVCLLAEAGAVACRARESLSTGVFLNIS